MRRVPSKLARVRRSRLLSQVDLAVETGITVGVLSRIERRKRPATSDEIARLSQALNVQPEVIFTDCDGEVRR